ncbi:MAG TPA: glycosyltransferase [Tepidisphaeraceae bacterium]|nr:glycosyltransferase [Tepidisphaeraceae bacterium]
MVSFALVPFNNPGPTLERIERVLLPTIQAYRDLSYEILLSDNSAQPQPQIEQFLRDRNLPHSYVWNEGRNLFYGGAINQIVQRARFDRLVYLCTSHGELNDPSWLADILAPFQHPRVAMAGSVKQISYEELIHRTGNGLHVQGGIFAARTSALRACPYTDEFPHLYSDVFIGWQLQEAGYYLADVGTIGCDWKTGRLQNKAQYKIVHEGQR